MTSIETGQKLTLLLRGIEVAQELRISRALAYRWMSNGTLPIVRVGKAVRVPRRALEEWVRDRTRGAGVAAAEVR